MREWLAEVPGFQVLPKRWVVERTFGWLMHCRRRVRDHEQTTASAAGWLYLAMIRLMLRRLPYKLGLLDFSDKHPQDAHASFSPVHNF